MNIRNFVIIAHIDHGKSTLADRLLEVTGTVPMRSMHPQYLDALELEQERGITIKMAPVRMSYTLNAERYTLNLIDTPGHSDFGYEVSRALMAVEGAVLLVDATQGTQAQTLANFEHARKAGLTIIGAVNKIDVASPEQVAAAREELANLLGVSPDEVLGVSGKTGAGVPELLEAIVARVPPPKSVEPQTSNLEPRTSDTRHPSPVTQPSRALIFDSQYDEHRGVIAYVRVFSGAFMMLEKEDPPYHLAATRGLFKPKEIGYFAPKLKPCETLQEGEIGYIATGIKDPDQLKIGDTIASVGGADPLPGFKIPKPVVFVSFYPSESDDYENLKSALGKLRLNDSSLAFLPDKNEVLGRGFKGGFLGQLHFEITAERIAREFGIETVHSFPSVEYRVKTASGWQMVNNPKDFPDDNLGVEEPMVRTEILLPSEYLGPVLQLTQLFRFKEIETKNFGSRIIVAAKLPLADLIRDLDDQLKSVTQGFASLNYEFVGYEPAEVRKLDILVAENPVAGLTRILPKGDIEREARKSVERLKELLPRQQFVQALQAVVSGKIVARETIPAMKKELGNFGKNGGDRTRKMKLWKKQARGKERLKERGENSQLKISANIFKELLKK
ncbi:MAG: translation elongation factor 4 [bacterium]|nr:translation elongation factor 4 [bacterium]